MFKIIVLVKFAILLNHLAKSVRKQNYEPYQRLKGIKCQSTNKSVSGYKCYVNAGCKNTTFNVFVNFTRPLFFIKTSYDLSYKSLSNSKRSIINVTFKACSILNGTDSNPVFRWFMKNLPALQEALHACPYKGNVIVKNIDLKMTIARFPAGIYITILKIYDDIDDNILTINIASEIISRDRVDFK